eukprot:TRINITY_DN1250_c0_g1_i1.p1 TRINITY_DN1250_c0_g1~~TRINITY_DN1250_c0_g1_i1.p1  ORF type:complete len:625 (-),score=125.77 TRINITY_DN1250_c0_g1_i1:62-1936(-)
MILPESVLPEINHGDNNLTSDNFDEYCEKIKDEEIQETTRVEVYTDAVFSIIATVMVLPLMEFLKDTDEEDDDEGLSSATIDFDLLENYFGFVLTYFILGALLRSHNQLFYRVSNVNGTLAFLNFVYLFILAGYPFNMDIITKYEAIQVTSSSQGGWIAWSGHACITISASTCQWIMMIYIRRKYQIFKGVKQPSILWWSFQYLGEIYLTCAIVILWSFYQPDEAFYGYVAYPIIHYMLVFIRKKLSNSDHKWEKIAPLPREGESNLSKEEAKLLTIEKEKNKRRLKYLKMKYKKNKKKLKRRLYHKFQSERMEAFSDGIFAISITLIAVNMDPPDQNTVDDLGLIHAILNMWSQYYGQFFSFVQLSFLWYFHCKMMKVVKKLTNLMFWINLMFLMFVSSLPFFAEMMSRYIHDFLTVCFLCSVLIVLGLSQFSFWGLIMLYRKKKHIITTRSYMLCKRNMIFQSILLLVLPTMGVINFVISYFINSDIALCILWFIPIIYILLFVFGYLSEEKYAHSKTSIFDNSNIVSRNNHDPNTNDTSDVSLDSFHNHNFGYSEDEYEDSDDSDDFDYYNNKNILTDDDDDDDDIDISKDTDNFIHNRFDFIHHKQYNDDSDDDNVLFID